MRRSLALAASVLGSILFAVAFVTAEQKMGIGEGYWSSGANATTTTDAILDRTDAGASRDALFLAGTGEAYRVAVIEAHGPVRVAWVLTASATLGDNCAITGGVVHGGLGGGDCYHFGPNGGRWDSRPNWERLRNRPGGARGICSVAHSAGHSGETIRIYPPCNIDGNCTTLVGSGTCTIPSATNLNPWTQDQLANVGAYLIHDADDDSGDGGDSEAQVNVRKEAIPR